MIQRNAAATAGLMCLLAFPSFADTVTLNSPDGAISVTGDLVGVTSTTFSIATAIGTMSIARSDVACEGPGCPQEATFAADVIVRGSDTVGEELFPLLVEGFAASQRAAVGKRHELEADTIGLDLNEDFGSGEKMASVMVQSAGSSTGLRALIAGETDIAMSSRPARAAEIRAIAEQGRGDLLSLEQEHIVAVDSILMIVSPNNPVGELTMEQAGQIFAGQITNWADVGGPDQAITVYTRPESSGTRGVFSNQVLRPISAEMASGAQVVGGNREMADKVTADAGGIGYVGFANLRDAKPLDLIASCGITMKATNFGAKTEEYPLQRRLRLFVDNGALSPMAKDLLEFAESPDADGLVRKAGFIDLGVEARAGGLDQDRLLEAALASEDAVALRLLRAMMLELGEAERLSTTFRFNPGSVDLDNKAQRDVTRVIDFLARPENANRQVMLVGFTDSDGSFQANAALSEGRAAVALEALRNHPEASRIAGTPMRSVGFGELAPVGCNDTFDGRKRNRRVELWIR